jgi:hypothetical protein
LRVRSASVGSPGGIGRSGDGDTAGSSSAAISSSAAGMAARAGAGGGGRTRTARSSAARAMVGLTTTEQSIGGGGSQTRPWDGHCRPPLRPHSPPERIGVPEAQQDNRIRHGEDGSRRPGLERPSTGHIGIECDAQRQRDRRDQYESGTELHEFWIVLPAEGDAVERGRRHQENDRKPHGTQRDCMRELRLRRKAFKGSRERKMRRRQRHPSPPQWSARLR